MDESGSDDVLRLILERVDSHVSLIRAAAVCKRWRRAIADAAFLRRYRSLHAPAVAGEFHNIALLSNEGPLFVPTLPPLVGARHFSLDFLPGGTASWILQDSRGSLLLICHAGRSLFSYEFTQFVCEPLTRRYQRIPPPADLDNYHCWRSYLIDGEADEAGGCIGISNFRVVCMFTKPDDANMHVDMYTVGSSWSQKNFNCITPSSNCSPVGHGGGCWYFVRGSALIILDSSTGDFSSSELPPLVEDWDSHTEDGHFFITNGRDGRLRIFTVLNGTMMVLVRLQGGEWVLEQKVLLSEATRGLPGYKPSFFSEPLYVVLVGTGYVILTPFMETWIFSINLETMEAASAVESMTSTVYGCELPWPPTFNACLDG
ncbi:unnamed protein product [Urochloa humidicola]